MDNTTHFALRLNPDLCTQCGICADSCAYGAIKINAYPEIDRYACRLCGTCVDSCPAGALSMDKGQEIAADESEGILVLAETDRDGIAPVTLELLGKASELGRKSGQAVEAVLVGHGVEALAAELTAYGASRVHLFESESLSHYIEENYAKAVASLVKTLRPAMMLVGATPKGRGLSARLAAMLGTGLTADCTELDFDQESGLLRQIRPAFGGNLMATIVTPGHRPQMASVRPGVMQALERDDNRRGEMVKHVMEDFSSDPRVSLVSEIHKAATGCKLGDSRVVVGIGRGVGKKETAERIARWAESIGAAVGGSRAAVECGLVDASRQIGQTGQTISPDLYIAIGISGQIQHTAAITGAKKIIAVNPDRNAPIFSVADYGWTATAEELLSALSEITIVQ